MHEAGSMQILVSGMTLIRCQFLRPWHSVIQMFALGSEQTHNGEVLLTFALGGQSMHSDTLADGRALYEIH